MSHPLYFTKIIFTKINQQQSQKFLISVLKATKWKIMKMYYNTQSASKATNRSNNQQNYDRLIAFLFIKHNFFSGRGNLQFVIPFKPCLKFQKIFVNQYFCKKKQARFKQQSYYPNSHFIRLQSCNKKQKVIEQAPKRIDLLNHSFISGCLTKMTRISMGRHQMRVELVLRVRMLRRTHFFMPLNSCLKPMFVVRLRNTMNCSRASTCRTLELTFSRKGFSLSAMVWLTRSPGCSSSAYSSWLVSMTRPSLVTALLMMMRIMRSLVTVLSSIFLQRMRGSSILQKRRMVRESSPSVMMSSPRWVVLLETSSGQEATMMLVVTPGLMTMLISFLQSLVPSRSRKYPQLMARDDSCRLRKATVELLKGREISPYCPGRMVPRLSWLGNFNNDLLFIQMIIAIQQFSLLWLLIGDGPRAVVYIN